jgi:uncharacterized protein (TIGR03000 family)
MRISTRILGALSLAGLFQVSGTASAQLLSTWGHPVFTFGGTPYDSVNTGHGNYPGGPGFIPGYGYYPGPGPGHYPWIDGPGVPFDRRKLAVAFPPVPPVDGVASGTIAEELLPPPDAALIVVKIPAEAQLWFNGSPTAQGGTYRRFISPPLEKGHVFDYTIRVHWRLDDVALDRSAKIQVEPGKAVTVDFLTVDGWTGTRVKQEGRR